MVRVSFELSVSISDLERIRRSATKRLHRMSRSPKWLTKFRKSKRLPFVGAGAGSSPNRQNAPVLSEFTCFSELPSELRLNIWGHAAFVPRNIDVWTSDFGQQLNIPTDGEDDPVDWFTVWKYSSRTPPPSVLSVCRESRTEALKHYTLDFGTSFSFRDFVFSTTPRIYINYHVDRLCFMESFQGAHMWDCIDFFTRCLKNGTRFLALNIRSFQGGEPWEICDYIKPTITRYTDPSNRSSMEEIILVNEYYHRDARGPLEFKAFPAASDMGDDGKLLHGMRKWLVEQELMLDEKGKGNIKCGPKVVLRYMEIGGERPHV